MNTIKKGAGSVSPSIKVLGYIGEKIPISNKKIENKAPIINNINIQLEGTDDLINNLKKDDIIEIDSKTIFMKIKEKSFFLEDYNSYRKFFNKDTKYLFKVLGYYMNYYLKNYIILYSFNSGAICKLSFEYSRIDIKKYNIDNLDNIYKFNIKSLKDKENLKYINKELCVKDNYIYRYLDNNGLEKKKKNQYCPLLESFNKDYFKRYSDFYSKNVFYSNSNANYYEFYKIKFENNGTKKYNYIKINKKSNNNNNNN